MQAWSNLLSLAASVPLFKTLPELLGGNEPNWRRWFNESEAEKVPLPGLERQIDESCDVGAVLKTLCVRMLRPDRFLASVSQCIAAAQWIQVPERTSAVGSGAVVWCFDSPVRVLLDSRGHLSVWCLGCGPQTRRQSSSCLRLGPRSVMPLRMLSASRL